MPQVGGNGGNLRATHREPTAVEGTAQGQADVLGPVPGCHQGAALVRQQREPRCQRRRLSAELDQQRNTASSRGNINLVGKLLGSDGPYPEGFRRSSPPCPRLR